MTEQFWTHVVDTTFWCVLMLCFTYLIANANKRTK